MDSFHAISANVESTEKLKIKTESGDTYTGRVPNEVKGPRFSFQTTYDGKMREFLISEQGGTVVMTDSFNEGKIMANVVDIDWVAGAL